MSMTPNDLPVVVGITGASGTILGFRLVQALLRAKIPVELAMTEKSIQVMIEEAATLPGTVSAPHKHADLVTALALTEQEAARLSVYGNQRIDAPPSSGTHLTRGMVVMPCSMGTLGKIAAGIGDNLVARAADVTLKERRPLVLVPRETPLNGIHLRNMLTLNQLGASIVPPVLTFYIPNAEAIEAQIDCLVGKVLDLLGVAHAVSPRWGKAIRF